MAAVPVDDERPDHRRVFVDAARWPAVVGDFMAGTGAAQATPVMASLARQPRPVLLRGTTLRADVTGFDPAGASSRRGAVIVGYVGDQGYPVRSRVDVTGDGTATGPLRQCAVGCTLLTLTVAGAPSFEVRRVVAGRTPVVTAPVHHDGTGPDAVVAFTESARPSPGLTQQALLTPGVTLPATVAGLDGTDQGVRVVGPVAAVPFLGRQGALLDLGRVLRGAVGTVAAGHAVVVARADTPAAVLARLHRDGGGRATTYVSTRAALDATPESRAAGLALLVAVGVALVALTHLLAWLSAQVGRRRTEVAGLRSAGVAPRAVRIAYLVEAVTLAAIVLVAAAVAGVATTSSLLRPMDLVGGWSAAPRVDDAVRPWLLGAVVVAMSLVTAAACAVTFTRFGRAARPSALREADK
jgi:hypothetical protein